MTAREYPVFTVTPKAERSLRAGHPWVYGEEVTAVEGAYQNGDMVDVVSNKGRYLGTGWVNDHSKIRVRIISRNANDTFDEAFFRRRVCYALNYRKTVMGPVDYRCCRLIFGEADQFPGLTVDRFENILVTTCMTFTLSLSFPNSIYCIQFSPLLPTSFLSRSYNITSSILLTLSLSTYSTGISIFAGLSRLEII